MTNDDARLIRDILAEHEAMKQARQSFEDQWNEIIETMAPQYRPFGSAPSTSPGEKRTQKIFDITPSLAARHFQAAMDSMITPRTQKYQRLTVADEGLRESPAVKTYLEQVTNTLFSQRYQWRSGFATQIGQSYQGHALFGHAGLMIDDVLGQGVRYRNIRAQRLWFSEDAWGMVDKAHMEWTLSVRQAAQKWGRDKLPASMQNALDRDPEAKYEFLHSVRPRNDRDPTLVDSQNMPIQSVWICISEQKIMEHSGFRVFPVAVSRFYVADDTAYGYSPAMESLPDIKMLNKMEHTNIKGAQKAVDPPLLLPEDGALEGFSLRSGALNRGMVDTQGNPLVHALNTGANAPLGIEYATQKREVVNLAFYVTLFQILVDNHQMTATEVLQRAQEKGVLLGPTMGRVQAEKLGAITARELDIYGHAGVLPEMPPELQEAGGEVSIEYDSPLNQAMRAEEGANVLRWAEAASPFIQADPGAARAMKGVQIVRGLADVFAVPSKYVASEDEIAQSDEMEAQQAQAAQLLEAAPVAADAAQKLSSAAVNATNARI